MVNCSNYNYIYSMAYRCPMDLHCMFAIDIIALMAFLDYFCYVEKTLAFKVSF